jgi:hypothetical protein
MIRRGHYSINTSKTQQKEKILKRKHWVISQECFSLTPLRGAESGNQVFSNEGALRSIVSSKTPLATLSTLDTPKDDSTCKSLLVELKKLPILKT